MNHRRIASLALVAISALALASCKDKAPQPQPSQTASSAALPVAQTAESWVKDHFAKDLGSEADTLRYAKAEVDLDGDGAPEILVYVGGSMMCGSGGCNLVVLKREGTGFRQVGDLSVVQLPVGVLDSKTHGWRDLAVSVSGGGMTAGIMKVPFDGKSYADNPTVSPAVPVSTIGKVVIPDAALKPLS